jgi:hypothetical protein
MAPATREFRDTLVLVTGALYDERMYTAVDSPGSFPGGHSACGRAL